VVITNGDDDKDGEGDEKDGDNEGDDDEGAPKTLAEAMAQLTVTDDGKDVPDGGDDDEKDEKSEEKPSTPSAASATAAPVEEAADDGDDFKPPPPPKLVKRNARKRSLIDKPPRILTCHLKRFQQQGRSLEKLGKYVSFPMTLDLLPYCVERKDNKQSLRYRLYGGNFFHHSTPSSSCHVISLLISMSCINSCCASRPIRWWSLCVLYPKRTIRG
jgi:hypothetical protein